MLDKIRKTINPSGLQAERDEIQTTLDALAVDREDRRLAAAMAAQQLAQSSDNRGETEICKLWDEFEAVNIEIAALRDRRREIDATLKPATRVRAALIDVPMSAELQRVQAELDQARNDRQSFLVAAAEARAEKSEAKERKLVAKIGEAEARIVALRVERAELLVPHNAAVALALEPIICEQANKLLAGAIAVREAISILHEAASAAPQAIAGMPWGIHLVGGIDLPAIMRAEDFARQFAKTLPGEAVA